LVSSVGCAVRPSPLGSVCGVVPFVSWDFPRGGGGVGFEGGETGLPRTSSPSGRAQLFGVFPASAFRGITCPTRWPQVGQDVQPTGAQWFDVVDALAWSSA